MYKIKINNNKFKCPMLNLDITERGEINYGICGICKFNILSQIINDTVYCNYGSSSGNSSSSGNNDPTNPNENTDPSNDNEQAEQVWEQYNN